jgi:hypothetical protein
MSASLMSEQPRSPERKWRDAGGNLAQLRRQLGATGSRQMWEVGDWLVAGEDEVFTHLTRARVRQLAAAITGYSRHTLSMAASVARKVAPSARVDGLSWWHHLVVAKLDPAAQSQWLVQAAEQEWSVRVLREQLNQTTRTPRRPRSHPKRIVSELVGLKREEIPESVLADLREWCGRELQLRA